jgi:hypothetical protein
MGTPREKQMRKGCTGRGKVRGKMNTRYVRNIQECDTTLLLANAMLYDALFTNAMPLTMSYVHIYMQSTVVAQF